MPFTHPQLIRLIRKLVSIDSQNPPGNERDIARFVASYFKKMGLSPRLVSYQKRRDNVIVRIPGRVSRQTLLLTPHLDTVPFGKNWKFHPLSGRLYRGRIYGRGATDCKASLAVGMQVISDVVRSGERLNYDIVFAATADEETGSALGLIPLLKNGVVRPDYALILDADECDVIVSQKGLLHLRIDIEGKKAHGAYPERGINAIDLAMHCIAQLKRLRFIYKAHSLLTPPTVNIGTIHGGDKVNMVADWCQVEVDIRYLPSMRIRDIIQQIRATIRRLPHARRYRVAVITHQKPYDISRNHMLVRTLKRAVQQACGRAAIKGSQGATVMTLFQRHGIPAIATGFGSRTCAHTSNEYVTVANLLRGYRALKKFLLLCNKCVTI